MALGVMVLACVPPAAAQSAEQQRRAQLAQRATVATQVHVGLHETGVEIVIDMSEPVQAIQRALVDPDRLVLDFPRLVFVGAPQRNPATVGPVKAWRYGAFFAGQARLILDLTEPLAIKEQRSVRMADGRARHVIRLHKVDRAAFHALSRPADDDTLTTATTAQNTRSGQQDLPLVVLDPGHGGIDPGATGPGGELEKAIVLDFAHELKGVLERGGKTRVVLTREGDSFLPLRDRVRIARQAKAAMFISLHADSLGDETDVRGGTVYTLADRATDERAQRLAERENKADLVAGVELKEEQDEVADILFDLARRETRAFSHHLARTFVQTLPKATRMHRIPHRGAGFRVLRAPDVPSVLLELGYLSSAEDAKLMTTEPWRKATAAAAGEAIEAFVAERLRREGAQRAREQRK
jgi:N-acetylmuramoyl-L-alanine amidase